MIGTPIMKELNVMDDKVYLAPCQSCTMEAFAMRTFNYLEITAKFRF